MSPDVDLKSSCLLSSIWSCQRRWSCPQCGRINLPGPAPSKHIKQHVISWPLREIRSYHDDHGDHDDGDDVDSDGDDGS